MTDDRTNVRKLISVRSQYGKWKSYDIVFEDKSHWDNWVDKMWGYGYKLESIYEFTDCSDCGQQHLSGECQKYCSGCTLEIKGEVKRALNGKTLCESF